MRDVNLFEDGFALGETMRGGEEGCEEQENSVAHENGWGFSGNGSV
jgi:hypothetical protein